MGFLFSKRNHIPVLCSAVRLRRARKVDRLKNIRLSLGIIPVKNICDRMKFKI